MVLSFWPHLNYPVTRSQRGKDYFKKCKNMKPKLEPKHFENETKSSNRSNTVIPEDIFQDIMRSSTFLWAGCEVFLYSTSSPCWTVIHKNGINYQIKWNKMSSIYIKYIILKQLNHFKLNNKMKSNHLWLSTLCIFTRQLKNICQCWMLLHLTAGTKLWWFKVLGLWP